jgi:formyl-CoA transferase
VLNLCRVKMRDQLRLDKVGPLEGVPAVWHEMEAFKDGVVPRGANAGGGGQPGWILKCKGWETDPNAYIYFSLDKLNHIFERIEAWTMTKTKFEVMDICNPLDIPVGPILSMKEIMEDEGLRKTGTIVDVDHPERGRYVTVGCPIKLSDSPVDVTRSPLLGEHTIEILSEVLGYAGDDLERIVGSGAVGQPRKIAAE